ncbi:MAG: hypothetical protein HY273_03265 [Gammaproteobacteria bacterium]|nr:hypothetical protein [Gammaproteobacteria bacterium]
MKIPARRKLLQHAVQSALLVGLCQVSTTWAAPWSLVNQPLSLTSKVPPNVLLIVDDSGSMEMEIMSTDLAHDGRLTGTQRNGDNPPASGKLAGTCKIGTSNSDGYSFGVRVKSNTIKDCELAEDEEWRFRNSNFNPFYFDPDKTYAPWPGFNSDGKSFTDMDVHKALANPWIGWRSGNSGNEAIDLTTYGKGPTFTGLRYYTWADKDGDGLFDNDDTVTPHLIANESAAVQKNFANWFTYSRSRHLIAKSAFGQLIANANGLRVGLATLHNYGSNLNVNVPLSLVDSTPAGTTNRNTLLSNLYKLDPAGYTPLQDTLKQAGEYLSGHAGNKLFPGNTAAPLTEAQGGACQQNFTLMMTDGFYNDESKFVDSSPAIGNADAGGNPPWDGGTYADTVSRTLADIAMYYYENDIIPTVPSAGSLVKVPTRAGVDEATHQHMVTYTVAFGVTGKLKGMPQDYAAHKPPAADAATWNNGVFPGWPSVASNNADKFSNEQRVDDLRHAAYNGRGEFLEANSSDSLAGALTRVLNGIQSRVGSGSAAAFNATSLQQDALIFQAGYDSGTWQGKLLYRPVGNTGVIGKEIAEAGNELAKLAANDRSIVTIDTTTRTGAAFRWSTLTADQKTALGSQQILDYLRGDAACESGHTDATCNAAISLRKRTNVLGDIIGSTPVYVGAPDGSHPDDASYTKFMTDNAGRTRMVYVGANDGMLHGFNASVAADGKATSVTAKELLAYVPGAVYKNLASLSNPAYSHRYFVDATPLVSDAKFSDGWHSVLLSGLRGGGQAMFALDVTNPANFAEDKAAQVALWEFNDVGTGAPGDKGDLDMGNTYGEPAIAKLAGDKWVDADGIADFAYAGDLFGNMWRFDLADFSKLNKLFTAQSSDTPPKMQSITVRPVVGAHPEGLEKGYLVYFGTGKFLENADNSTVGQTTQSFYALWDQWPKGGAASFSAIPKTALQMQTILEVTSKGFRITSDTQVDWKTQQGWSMDLIVAGANNGERVIYEPLLRNGQVLFSTFMPSSAICGANGSGYVMVVSATSGARPGVPPLDINGDNIINASDMLPYGSGASKTTAAVTGYTSSLGFPATPVFIEGTGGTVDYVAVSYSGGYEGGIVTESTTLPPLAALPLNQYNAGIVKGRVTWKRLK